MSAATMLPSQRHTKLKASEAALLAGELTKPSWQSRNEGIHERVSFEDSIWGFDLAGGSFYKTPLRVTAVKRDSRAEKAGIRPGDQLLRINDIDTSTLTIQEAHAIIIESGIHIRLAVSAPEDTEDSYHCWQDQIDIANALEEARRKEEENARRRVIRCRTNANWSLQWPWVSKRRIIYRESNCFMVPSKYESKHRDKFPEQIAGLKTPEDIVLHSKTSETPTTEGPKNIEFPTVNGTDIPGKDANANEASDLKVENSNNVDEIPTQNEIRNGSENDQGIQENEMQMPLNGNIESAITNGTSEINSEMKNDDQDLENWDPNDAENAMDEDQADDILEDNINDNEEIQEDEQDKILDEILNGNEESQNGDEQCDDNER